MPSGASTNASADPISSAVALAAATKVQGVLTDDRTVAISTNEPTMAVLTEVLDMDGIEAQKTKTGASMEVCELFTKSTTTPLCTRAERILLVSYHGIHVR